jgi:uncharacterized DUF497 family protein
LGWLDAAVSGNESRFCLGADEAAGKALTEEFAQANVQIYRHDDRLDKVCSCSTAMEERWKGIASFDRRVYFFISFTERERIRIISARLAEPFEKERYDQNYQAKTGGYYDR